MPPARGKLTPRAPLAPLVWFKSGGAAEWLFEPADIDDLMSFLAVLDPDVKRIGIADVTPGSRVTLIGLVRPAPEPEDAMRRWSIDAATARALRERGTYLHVTEVHAG